MKRLVRLTLPVAMVAAIAGVGWSLHWILVSDASNERVVLREAPPSCDDAVAELGLQEQDVNCTEPAPASPEVPRNHGPYRLVPAGYVGPLSYDYIGPPQLSPGNVTTDMEELQASSLYRAPSFMPDGYALSSMDTFDGDSESVIRCVYVGPGRPIEVYRVRRYTRPIDVYLPPPDALRVIQAAYLDGNCAILSYPLPGSFLDGKVFTRVSFVEGVVETTVRGDSLDLDVALQIARSLR